MTVRVEKLSVSGPSVLTLAVLGIVSSAAAILFRWWQQPTTLVMSEDWLNDRARIDAQRGWD